VSIWVLPAIVFPGCLYCNGVAKQKQKSVLKLRPYSVYLLEELITFHRQGPRETTWWVRCQAE